MPDNLNTDMENSPIEPSDTPPLELELPDEALPEEKSSNIVFDILAKVGGQIVDSSKSTVTGLKSGVSKAWDAITVAPTPTIEIHDASPPEEPQPQVVEQEQAPEPTIPKDPLAEYKNHYDGLIRHIAGPVTATYTKSANIVILEFAFAGKFNSIPTVSCEFTHKITATFRTNGWQKTFKRDKTITVQARFKVSAVVMPNKPIVQFVIPANDISRPTIDGVKAQLLACEYVDHSFTVVERKDHAFNRINTEDEQAAKEKLIAQATKASFCLSKTNILQSAESDFCKQINRLYLQENGTQATATLFE